MCPSRQRLSFHVSTTCRQPVLQQQQQAEAMRCTFPPLLCPPANGSADKTVMGVIHRAPDRLDPGPRSLSATTEHYGNFSLICQMGFLSQTAIVKLETVTCGSRGAQSLHVWFSVSASSCAGVMYSCTCILFISRERRSVAHHSGEVKLWCCIGFEHYHEMSRLKPHTCTYTHTRRLDCEDWSWHLGILWAHTQLMGGKIDRGWQGRDRKRERQLAAACHPQLTQEAW